MDIVNAYGIEKIGPTVNDNDQETDECSIIQLLVAYCTDPSGLPQDIVDCVLGLNDHVLKSVLFIFFLVGFFELTITWLLC